MGLWVEPGPWGNVSLNPDFFAKVSDVEISKLPIIDVTSNGKVSCSGKVLIWYSADDGSHQKKGDLERKLFTSLGDWWCFLDPSFCVSIRGLAKWWLCSYIWTGWVEQLAYITHITYLRTAYIPARCSSVPQGKLGVPATSVKYHPIGSCRPPKSQISEYFKLPRGSARQSSPNVYEIYILKYPKTGGMYCMDNSTAIYITKNIVIVDLLLFLRRLSNYIKGFDIRLADEDTKYKNQIPTPRIAFPVRF